MNEQDFQRIVREEGVETRRHFDVVAEGLRSEIRMVAESVTHVDDKLGQFRTDVAQEFAETRAMIKFSHAELDRRVRSLEDSVVRLEARVERLESAAQR